MSLRTSIQRQRMTKQGGVLPSGYTECQYIESSGTQYIDTRYIIGVYSGIYINFIGVSVSARADNFPFGTRSASGGDTRWWLNVKTPNINIEYGYGQFYHTSLLFQLGTPYQLAFIYKNDYVVLTQGTQEFRIKKYPISVFTNMNTLWVFGCNASGLQDAKLCMKLYECIVSEGEDDVMNFIPALDKNGRPCLFDIVSRQTFYNNGSGEFGYETKDGVYVAPR